MLLAFDFTSFKFFATLWFQLKYLLQFLACFPFTIIVISIRMYVCYSFSFSILLSRALFCALSLSFSVVFCLSNICCSLLFLINISVIFHQEFSTIVGAVCYVQFSQLLCRSRKKRICLICVVKINGRSK